MKGWLVGRSAQINLFIAAAVGRCADSPAGGAHLISGRKCENRGQKDLCSNKDLSYI